jgi:hypothetical protein
MCFSKRYSAVTSDTEREPHGSCVPDHWRGGLNLAVGQIALPRENVWLLASPSFSQ